MIPEKMLEFLCLDLIFKEHIESNAKQVASGECKTYLGFLKASYPCKFLDMSQMDSRYKKLLHEFVEPYVIDSTSKE